MKEEIEKLLSCNNCDLKEYIGCEITYTDREKIKDYIEQVELDNQKNHHNYIKTLLERDKQIAANKMLLEREHKLIDKLNKDIKIYSQEGCCRKQVREGIVREAQEILDVLEEKNE